MAISLRLLVLRTHNVESLMSFYQSLGFVFAKEQHGKGPEHFSAPLGSGILEIYPLAPQHSIDTSTRLGFAVPDLTIAADRAADAGGKIVKPIADTPWGTLAILKDPDGRTVEIYQS